MYYVKCIPIVLLWQIRGFKCEDVCMKSDLFCYYKKDCSGTCWTNEVEPRRNRTEKSLKSDNNNILKMASGSGMNGLYRPRSALARAIYEKHRNDIHLEELDKNEWYKVDNSQLSPELQQKFVQLGPDEETKEFLSNSIEKSSWVWTQIWYLIAKAVLKYFWSITDINGWLGRGSMFVLSNEQARLLLKSRSEPTTSFVDVGAGDGEVSRRFASIYPEKYATEISACMQKALTNKGYTLLDTERWWQEQRFDCVSMLNLVDRCARPRTMLQQARAALSADGLLLLALVLPYKPYVEVTADHKPEERLPIEGSTFEAQVTSLVSFTDSLGLSLVSWSRAPYLCEGDFAQAYYWLDDSVYVFRNKPIHSS